MKCLQPDDSTRLERGASRPRNGRVGLTSKLDTAQNRTSFSNGTKANITRNPVPSLLGRN